MATFVYPPVQLSTAGLATEAKQDTIITALGDVNSELDTHTTELQAINSELNSQTTLLTSIDGKDFATETTLAALNTKVATETTLASILADTTSLDGKDFATETTLTALSAKVTAVDTSALATESTLAAQAADLALLEDRLAGALVPEEHDYVQTTYVTAGNGIGEIETVTYKTGGAAGTTVATLTLAYDANDRLDTVTRT